ncbi:MAG: sugar transferase [Ruminococcaceae bacterium]|nr:sugar transferase [Oscillospiraceae bacterium]
MYAKFFKRLVDILCALLAIVVFSWLYIIVAILVRVKLGSPVIFKQPRPGLNGKIFTLYKFRTMTDEKDEDGNLLPDEIRLTKFGKLLRATSLDELPEAFNILKGDMSVIGPRPQLVRDMTFFTDEQMKRQSVRPGLSGLAQVKGRNGITWEEKIDYDLEYIKKITFFGDVKIIFQTVWSAFVKQDGVSQEGMDTAEDLGDYLLRIGKVDKETYDKKQEEAKKLLNV